jgi:hypothetical protein
MLSGIASGIWEDILHPIMALQGGNLCWMNIVSTLLLLGIRSLNVLLAHSIAVNTLVVAIDHHWVVLQTRAYKPSL